MRIILTAQKHLLRGLIALLAGVLPAFAEQLVMPFRCEVRGGEVRLSRSQERAYDILGVRQKHVFSVCSPTDHSRCRNWEIHRFDIDCAGRRVPWIDVVAAASRFHGEFAWVDGGQMHFEVPSLGVERRDEPYGGATWAERRQRARERFPYGPGPGVDAYDDADVVELPPGFAPTLGLPVTFVGRDGERGSFNAVEGPPPPPSYDGFDDRAEGPGSGGGQPPAREVPRRVVEAERPPPVPQPANRPATIREKAVETSPPTNAIEADAAKSETGKTVVAAPKDAPPKTPSVSAPKSAEKDGAKAPVVPMIINAGQPKEVATQKVAAAHSSTAKDGANKEQITAGADQIADGKASVTAVELASPPSPRGEVAAPLLLWIIYAAAALGAVVAGAFLLIGRAGGSIDAQHRDLWRVSLGGDKGGRPSTELIKIQPSDGLPQAAGELQSGFPADLRIPATREEALRVLGASADAAIEVVKKIVDGLRQSWHPDLAKTDADRLYREKRMAQINVAWDIIQAHRRSAG